VFTPRTSASAPPFSAPCPVAGQSPCGNVSVSPYDASGKDMIRAPKFTFGANFDYAIHTGAGVIGLSGNAFYSGKYYWDFENRIAQPSYVQLNGEISWATSDSDKAARFSIWGRNLANEVIYAQVLTAAQGDVVGFERPRSYGVSVSKRF
jgi:iron complex outermembrane receptor protein